MSQWKAAFSGDFTVLLFLESHFWTDGFTYSSQIPQCPLKQLSNATKKRKPTLSSTFFSFPFQNLEGSKALLQNTIAVLELNGPQLPSSRTQLNWYKSLTMKKSLLVLQRKPSYQSI